jgi:L-asparaginase
MIFTSLKLATLAALVPHVLAAPAPIPIPEPILKRDGPVFNASLPNVTIYATGGTIAGSAGSSSAVIGYKAGSIGVDALIEAVPAMLDVANIKGVQVANVASDNIDQEHLLNMTRQIQADLDNPYTAGVVVTHGTDTLEETAYWLALTVKSEKPIVVVGAMRPATAISADGPVNLLASVTLAASPEGRGRGSMVVLNDRIASGIYVTKTNANSIDTFKATEQGYLGYFSNIQPKFFYPPALPVGWRYFNVSAAEALPRVDIHYGHQGLAPSLVTASVDQGAKGIVLAGMGAGGWTSKGAETVGWAAGNGTLVVTSHRSQDGIVPNSGSEGGEISANFLNPQKARILLQLCINAGFDFKTAQSVFEI